MKRRGVCRKHYLEVDVPGRMKVITQFMELMKVKLLL